jgi:hypothetical protein
VDKTPVFDGAAGGFVYVYGVRVLKKRRSAILSLFEPGAFPDGIVAGSTTKNAPPSTYIAGR